MQPRQRSKCSTTVSVRSIDPSRSPSSTGCARAASPSPRARACTSGTSADRSRNGHSRRSARAAHRLHDAFGERAPLSDLRVSATTRLGPRPDERRRAAVPASTSGQVGLQRAQPAHGSASSPPSSPTCASTARGEPSKRTMHPSLGDIDCARYELRAVKLGPARSAVATVRAQPAAGCSRSASCSTRPSRLASRRRASRGRSRRRSSPPCRPRSRASRPAAVTVTPSTRSRIVPNR